VKAAIPVVISMTLVLAACSTTGNMREVNLKKASQVNAELGLRYLNEGELQLAKLKAEKAIEQDKRNALANNINGTVQERLGNLDDADEYFRRAVQLAPDQPEYANSYGAYLCDAGRVDDGVAQFEKVARNPLHRTPALAYENAAMCAMQDKKLAVAERNLQAALKLEPGYARARFGLTEIQFAGGRYGEALANVQQLEKESKLNAEVAALGVRAAKALKRPDVAEHYHYILQSRFPDSYQARALSN